MSSHNFHQNPHYLKLVKTLKKVSSAFINQISAQQRQKNLSELWELGKQIKQTHQKFPRGKKEAMMKALAKDTQISRTDLSCLSNFYTCFKRGIPKINQGENLNWTHFRRVLPLKDQQERMFYLRYTAQEGLSTRYLDLAIRSNLYLSEKLAGGDHPHGLLTPNLSFVFTFKTVVLQIKDGDTLRLRSDKGFFNHQEYTGRLRGINASELKGPNVELALKAKAHVEKVLAPCEFVMITTYKPDSFGRTLVDLRYHPLWKDPNKVYEQGFFLNQELLDLGLARLAPF